jgi:hypothetical protein
MKREIIYPVFVDASKFIDDCFWKQIFEDLAYGYAPYGSYFSKGFFCCSYKGKEFSYKVESNDAQKIFMDVHHLLANRMGIASSHDRARKIQDFERLRDEFHEIRNSKWNSIKRKTSRDFIIESFIVDMKKQHRLSDGEARKLNALISIGLLFKSISHKDIQYADGKIVSINGITFERGKVNFEPSTFVTTEPSLSIIFQEKALLSELWYKYVKENAKKTLEAS